MTEKLQKALKLIDQVQFGKDCVSSGVARGVVLDQLRALLTTALAETEEDKSKNLLAPAMFEPVSDFAFSAEPPLTKTEAHEVVESLDVQPSVEAEETTPIRERDLRIPMGSPKPPRTRKKPT